MTAITRRKEDEPGGSTLSAELTKETLHRQVDALPAENVPEAAALLYALLTRDGAHERALIDRWIRPHASKGSGGEAVLADFHVPVYALVGYHQAVGGDADRVARDYDLPRAAVEGALAYYRRHRAVVDARIAANLPPEG